MRSFAAVSPSVCVLTPPVPQLPRLSNTAFKETDMRAEQPMSVRCALRWVQQRRKVVAGVLLVAVVGAVFLWPAQNQWDDAFSAMPSELNFIPRHQAAAAALPPSQRDL